MGPVEEKIVRMDGSGRSGLAWLIDPDCFSEQMEALLRQRDFAAAVDFIFVGGSLLHQGETDQVVRRIKALTSVPVVLFPGSGYQMTPAADALFFLVLLSGRNPEYLVGKQVEAAPIVVRYGLEAIPTGYLLVDGGRISSAHYVSATLPLPADKPDLAATTALAGRLMGQRVIYMDAGSGAARPVHPSLIRAVREHASVPVVVGGGLRTPQDLARAWQAGAAICVVGNLLEKEPDRLWELAALKARMAAGA